MCGIGGYVDPGGVLDGGTLLATLATALAHRGPDGEGFFTDGPFGLAHRRLAIIELSDAGAQPMHVGPLVVVYNGEIYNYRELREELRRAGHDFSSSSDTEVLARAYLHWGEQCTRRLRGMWAFAIFDSRKRTLVCARDPFGIKPFYYARRDGAWLFASEPQALVRAGVPARAHLVRAAQYLAYGVSDHAREGFFAGIEQLGAGETIVVGADGRVRFAARVDACTTETANCGTATTFAASLEASIRLHLRSDVPVGTCLSGGLDSSTVAALASSAVRASGGPRFAAVTAASGEPKTDERRYAAAVVQHCDLAWHVVTPRADDFAAHIDDCLRAQGEPALSPSVYFQYCVMRAARAAGLKVMLDGQGADELLCGYERYIPVWTAGMVREMGLWRAIAEFVRLARHSRPGLAGMLPLTAYVLSPWLRRSVIARRTVFLRLEFLPDVLELAAAIARSSRGLLSARLADICTFSLPALLRYEDRNSMAHSVEARVPYVDRQVIASALGIRDRDLLGAGFTKRPLRAVADRLLPHEIAWRHAKVGFEPPTGRWLAPLRARMQEQVDASALIGRLCRRPPRMEALPLALQWRLYNLARWQQLFAVELS